MYSDFFTASTSQPSSSSSSSNRMPDMTSSLRSTAPEWRPDYPTSATPIGTTTLIPIETRADRTVVIRSSHQQVEIGGSIIRREDDQWVVDIDLSSIDEEIIGFENDIVSKMQKSYGVEVQQLPGEIFQVRGVDEGLVEAAGKVLYALTQNSSKFREFITIKRHTIDITKWGGLIIGKGGSTIKYLQRSLNCRILTHKTKTRTTITGLSSDDDTLAMFQGRIEDILENPEIFAQELEDRRAMKLHVFVDASNILLSSQLVGNMNQRDISIRVRVDKLIEIVLGGRHLESGRVVGSTPRKGNKFWERWEAAHFKVDVLEPVIDSVTGKKFEQGVDDVLQSLMFRDACEEHIPARTFVLLTGDGNSNNGRVSFPRVLDVALGMGWNVEVWSWKISRNAKYDELKTHPNVKIYDLEDYKNEILFRDTTTAATAVARK